MNTVNAMLITTVYTVQHEYRVNKYTVPPYEYSE